MRLLDTTTMKFSEFFDQQVPKYAILSHRWEEEEVLFQDMNSRAFEAKKGYPKLKGACDQAARDGYQYVWIETCCIDKSSSAELSEAINSMFKWYQDSAICYAYLSDVSCHTGQELEILRKSFGESKWFTRGWTLQELIAPTVLIFFDQEWAAIGTRPDWAEYVSQISGMPVTTLQTNHKYMNISVAQKMSWLARRTTTRVEDMAYCMLGIFGVFMPSLYGEGESAFQRLQLEILKTSDDESIFAWRASPSNALLYPDRGMLAHSASEFRTSSDMVKIESGERPPYSVTNKGLEIRFGLTIRSYSNFNSRRDDEDRAYKIYVAKLNCRDTSGETVGRRISQVGILLKRCSYRRSPFTKVFPHLHTTPYNERSIFLKGSPFFGGNETEPEPKYNVNFNQAIYVTLQKPIFQPRVSKFRSVRITGAKLQSYLSEIITIYESEHWVEYKPFQFLNHATDASYPTAFMFKGRRDYTSIEGILNNSHDRALVILFYSKDNIPVTRLTTISIRTIKNRNLLRTFLHNAVDEETNENSHGILEMQSSALPSPWIKSGWSISTLKAKGVLKLEFSTSTPLEYTLYLSEE